MIPTPELVAHLASLTPPVALGTEYAAAEAIAALDAGLTQARIELPGARRPLTAAGVARKLKLSVFLREYHEEYAERKRRARMRATSERVGLTDGLEEL